MSPTRYVPALTGLRAIAAYLVFLHHYNPALPDTFAYRLFSQGYTGVSLFFVLSGFLIFHQYADTYLTGKNWSWRMYLQNRFARIYPLYALLFVITAGANTLIGRPMSVSIIALNLTLVKGFFEAYKFSGIAQSWSLTVELCFYVSAPILFVGLQRWGALRLTAGLIGSGLLIWKIAEQLSDNGEPTPGFFGSLPFVLFYTFFGRAFEFVAGMWVARRWQQYPVPTYRYATFSGLVVMCICVLWQATVPQSTISSAAIVWNEVLAYNCFLPVGIGALLWGLLQENSRIRYVLSWPIFQALGRSSYAFYLIHLGVIASGLQKLGITNRWLLFALLILVAHALYSCVEKPLNRYLRAS